jgi:hypothetical protein
VIPKKGINEFTNRKSKRIAKAARRGIKRFWRKQKSDIIADGTNSQKQKKAGGLILFYQKNLHAVSQLVFF